MNKIVEALKAARDAWGQPEFPTALVEEALAEYEGAQPAAQPAAETRHGEYCLCAQCLPLSIRRDERDRAAEKAAQPAAQPADQFADLQAEIEQDAIANLTQQERERFEAFALEQDRYWLEGTTIKGRTFSSENTEHAWRGWQASLAAHRRLLEWPVMGVRVDGGSVIIRTRANNNDEARWLCKEIIDAVDWNGR